MGAPGIAPNGGKIRVLVVDDSAIVRKVLSETLRAETDIEVVGTAPDPFVARDKIVALNPDVLTLDIEMPRMDGLSFLDKLMQHRPLPVIVISSITQAGCHTAMEALRRGAVEVLCKPGGPYTVADLVTVLPDKIRAAAAAGGKVRKMTPAPAAPPPASAAPANGARPAAAPTPKPAPPPLAPAVFAPSALIAIGASTGGTQAIEAVLTRMPANSPPIVITQHIPAVFSRAFAERLNRVCAIQVKEAADGDPLAPGCALVAPGDYHMAIRRAPDGSLRASIRTGPKVNYQRPSVDVMFSSLVELCPRSTVGVLLTGMGSDGADGLGRMRAAGAHTIAQNEASCVVYGMPREAVRRGAAVEVLDLGVIAEAICRSVKLHSGSAVRH